jgi:hypothetical protein
MELYKKFQNFSRLRQIGCVVFTLHFFFIFSLLIHHFVVRHPPKRPIAVRTRHAPIHQAASSPPKISAPHPSTPQTKPKAPLAKPSTKPAAPAKPKSTSKNKSIQTAPKTPTKPKPPEARPTPEPAFEPEPISNPPLPKSDLLLPSLLVPSMPELSHVKPLYTEESSAIDPSYEELLIATFQSALDLPEIGEVKVRLEIDARGHLIDCTILETKSRKNGEFLKHRLPELLFPCFPGEEIQSFTVIFRNAN